MSDDSVGAEAERPTATGSGTVKAADPTADVSKGVGDTAVDGTVPSPPTTTPRSSSIGSSQPSTSKQRPAASDSSIPPPPAPPVYKRKSKRKPKGILKPAPPPAKAFSFRRDILQQLNTRLAQQGVNVQVPVPQGSLAGTAQGTAQAAGNLLGGMLKRVSGFAAANLGTEEQSAAAAQRRSSAPSASIAEVASPNGQGSRTSMQESRSADAGEPSGIPAQATPTHNLPQPSSSARPLRKVRFTVTSMSVVYPISGAISPGEEDATRKRIDEQHRKSLKDRQERTWTLAELEQLYRDCCRMREELPLRKMRDVFQLGSQLEPPMLKTVDLSFVPLDRHAIEPIADLLSVDFGLQKLVLENCGLTDEGVKSILHALLVSGGLSSLSLASNKRIKYQGWRYVGIFMRRARALKYLDLSENSVNRASVEHILDALDKRRLSGSSAASKKAGVAVDEVGEEVEEEGPLTVRAKLLSERSVEEVATLTSLRMENCGLKTSALEMMGQAVRHSDLCHLSLRRNRINQSGAVALAVMLKDYPDSEMDVADQATPPIGMHTESNGRPVDAVAHTRGRDLAGAKVSSVRSLSPGLPNIPILVSSPGGGVTRRTLPPEAIDALREATNESIILDGGRHPNAEEQPRVSGKDNSAAIALYHAQRAKRILSSMPRMGSLLTLDLKGNDIRSGVLYLSHALKKNRTLKVLNLSDNNIEGPGLVAIANALKYNSTLETLDMSHNPCSGPTLDGITTLRTAFTLNSNLKRLFLSDTDLSSEGAIALAEFLPEARSLIHLDLTENLQIDIAGVMALAVSVKMNKSLRCLDLNIPANAPDFARLSQDILNSCIRNTEAAQRRAQQKGVKAPIAAPIYKSTLARAAKEKEETARLQHANQQIEQEVAAASSGQRPVGNVNLQSDRPALNAAQITEAASECVKVLCELMEREQEQDKERERERSNARQPDGSLAPRPMSEFARELMQQSRQLRSKLKKALGVMQDGEMLERALQVNDDLESVSSRLIDFYRGGGGKQQTPVRDGQGETTLTPSTGESQVDRLPLPLRDDEALSSPNFSIGSSDDEEDEELDGQRAARVAVPDVVSAVGSTLAGLGIDQSILSVETPKAAREAPSEDDVKDNVHAESALVNERAKGQLEEEGEIFRRARSLSIGQTDEEEEEEEEEGGEKGEEASTAMPKEGDEDPLKSETGKGDSEHDLATLQEEPDPKHVAGVSGDELRKELLEKDVPRRRAEADSERTTTVQNEAA